MLNYPEPHDREIIDEELFDVSLATFHIFDREARVSIVSFKLAKSNRARCCRCGVRLSASQRHHLAAGEQVE